MKCMGYRRWHSTGGATTRWKIERRSRWICHRPYVQSTSDRWFPAIRTTASPNGLLTRTPRRRSSRRLRRNAANRLELSRRWHFIGFTKLVRIQVSCLLDAEIYTEQFPHFTKADKHRYKVSFYGASFAVPTDRSHCGSVRCAGITFTVPILAHSFSGSE